MANKDKAPASTDIVSQVTERIRNSSNILVALSKDPSIDELTAALSLTLILEKSGKHATAIFSGNTPNIISFLQPEKTFESNTDSLQDFIIALDKEKADHIRYKIDGDFVKVFITPYKTTINEKDLEFSHGDFNVDLVIALNVKSEAELDSALVEYGRIKHDASSINISPAAPGNFGDLEWGDPGSSSVSEMIYRLAMELQDPEAPLVDENVATTILTGIISATNRFSNERTTADTLASASNLLALGANQQLIAKNVPVDILTPQQEAVPAPEEKSEEAPAEKIEETPKEEIKPEASTESEQPAPENTDPTNFEITHPGKTEEAKDETERIVEQLQQKQADEQAKADAEAERKRKEQEEAQKAEEQKNQEAKDAVFAKVNAEHAEPDPVIFESPVEAPKKEEILPPIPPQEFNKPEEKQEPKVEPVPEPVAKPAAEPIAMPIANEKPESQPVSEPVAIPNALSTDSILPPPPAPFNAEAMPPVLPTEKPVVEPAAVPNPAPVVPTPVAEVKSVEEAPKTKIPTANEIAAEYQAKKEALKEKTAPVMPAVTMPSAESVARAMNPVGAPAAVAPAPAPAAPTLAPRPAETPASPVVPAAPAAPAPTPTTPSNPVNDPGAFHIPGM